MQQTRLDPKNLLSCAGGRIAVASRQRARGWAARFEPDCDGRRFELGSPGTFGVSERYEVSANYGAGGRIRTADPRITNALLYRLSYTGVNCY